MTGSRVVVDPGAVFTGTVNGGGGSTLELAKGSHAGSLGGLGSQYSGFSTLTVDAGASWRLTGSNSFGGGAGVNVAGALNVGAHASLQTAAMVSITSGSFFGVNGGGTVEIGSAGGAAHGVLTIDPGGLLIGAGHVGGAIVDNGSLIANGGTLATTQGIGGTGTAGIDPNAALQVTGALGVSTLSFYAGGHETLFLGKPTQVTSTIDGFGATDTIDLRNFVAALHSFAANTLVVNGTAGEVSSLHFAPGLNHADFLLGNDHHGGTLITFV